jgi:hypothetical protein
MSVQHDAHAAKFGGEYYAVRALADRQVAEVTVSDLSGFLQAVAWAYLYQIKHKHGADFALAAIEDLRANLDLMKRTIEDQGKQ